VDEDNNFIENEKEQYWIEYMKVRHEDDGIPISQIARELNTCEVPAKRGEKWSHKTGLKVDSTLMKELIDG